MPEKNVLIIDDDTDVCRSLCDLFKRKGFAVSLASSGKAALEQIRRIHYSAIMIDRCLPDMRGTDLLVPLKEYQPNAVKVMLTGTPMADMEVDVEALGLDAFFLKPVNPLQLFDIIESKQAKRRSK